MLSTLRLLAVTLTLSAAAFAAPLEVFFSSPSNNLIDAETARAAWAGPFTLNILEDFESFAANQNTGYTTLPTNVGNISVNADSHPSTAAGTGNNELLILDNSQTRFGGRFNTTPGGSNWLDSNDITSFTLSLNFDTNNLFFFMTDVEDVGAANIFKVVVENTFGDIVEEIVSATPLSNGAYHFVGIRAEGLIQQVSWLNPRQTNDGFGIDDIGVLGSQIPEPGSLLLLGSGLVLAGIARRRRSKNA